MTAKEYLSQVLYIDQRINCKLEQVMRLRENAAKATATLSDMPHSDSPNLKSMENTICKIVDLEREINRDIDQHEIEKYKEDNIYTLEVAEVENLFLVEELVREMSIAFGEDPEEVLHKAKDYIVQKRFSGQINKQICQSVVAYLKYRLSVAELSKKNGNEAKESLNALFQSLNYEQIEQAEAKRFKDALTSNGYKQVLRVFNEKSLVSLIASCFGLKDGVYCRKVIALLQGEKHDAIVAAIAPYLPSAIQR